MGSLSSHSHSISQRRWKNEKRTCGSFAIGDRDYLTHQQSPIPPTPLSHSLVAWLTRVLSLCVHTFIHFLPPPPPPRNLLLLSPMLRPHNYTRATPQQQLCSLLYIALHYITSLTPPHSTPRQTARIQFSYGNQNDRERRETARWLLHRPPTGNEKKGVAKDWGIVTTTRRGEKREDGPHPRSWITRRIEFLPHFWSLPVLDKRKGGQGHILLLFALQWVGE